MPVTNRLYEKSQSAIIATPTPLSLLNYENKSVANYSTDSSNNISVSFITYDTNISKIVNTGYNTSDWAVDWLVPLNNSGYALFLRSTSGPSTYKIIFYTYEGNEIYKHTAVTNNRNYGTVSGEFAYFIDFNNHQLIYSDGNTYQVYDFDPTLGYFTIENYYDNILDNGFIIGEYGLSNDGPLYRWSLATPSGVVPLGPALNGNFEESSILYNRTANFIAIIHSQAPGYIPFVSLFSNTGQFIRDIYLPNTNYNNFNIDFYGTNKVSIIFYDGGDNTTPYLIYNYDGSRDKVLMTYHDRFPHFNNYEIYYDSHHNSYTTSNYLSEDIHYLFVGNQDGWNNDLMNVGYADVLSVFDGDLEFRSPYVINNSGDPYTSIGWYTNFIGSSFMMPVVNYNDNIPHVKILNIQKDSTSYKTIRPVSELDDLNMWYDNAGDNYILVLFTNYASDGTIYVFDGKTGNLRDSKVFTSNINWWNNYDTIYFQDYGNEGNVSWYMNSATSKFQIIESTDPNIDSPDSISGPPYSRPGNIILFNSGTGRTRVITRTNFYDFNLPISDNGYYNLTIGTDVILYGYYSNNSSKYNVALYNLKGAYQAAGVSKPSSGGYFNVVGNRAYFTYNNGNDTYTVYTFTPGNVKSSTLSDYNLNPTPNDYRWWD